MKEKLFDFPEEEHNTKEKQKDIPFWEETEDNKQVQHHPPACAAVELELREFKDDLGFRSEFTLNTLPNKLDLLVVKKYPNRVIPIGFAEFFRIYNIFEYKSPDDDMDVPIFHRSRAYADLLAAYFSDSVSYNQITITFMRRGYPRNLIQYLLNQGYTLSEHEKGIYYLTREGDIPIQIMVLRTLAEKYPWLSTFDRVLTSEEAHRVISEIGKLTSHQDRTNAESWFDLAVKMNEGQEWVKELIGMGALRDLFQPEFDRMNQTIKSQETEIQTKNQELEVQRQELQNKDQELQNKDQELLNLTETN